MGTEAPQDKDLSATTTKGKGSTAPELWASTQRPLNMEEVRMHPCKLGELCWLAMVSRPEICARLARLASRVNSLVGSDVYQINDLLESAKEWLQATAFEYLAGLRLGT